MSESITINGKTYSYNEDTVFQVQVGKGKGKYATRYTFTGDIKTATRYYACINIGNGYKKRFVINGKTVVRAFS